MPSLKEQFIISTFAGVRHGDDIERIIPRLHQAGLNALESNTPLEYSADDLTREEHRRVLHACEGCGMRYVLTDHTRMTGVPDPSVEMLRSLVDDYAGFPALGGYYVWDEPEWEQLESVARTVSILRDLDPARMPILAMVPSYGKYPYPAYVDFIHDYIQIVNPDVLSFDFYGVREGKTVEPDLYRDLATWSEASLRTGKPLWFYPSSCKWGPVETPGEATLRFQVFTAIAYGAKGIQYFVAKDFTGGRVDFTHAPLDAKGNPGPVFETFANLNAQIHSCADTIMGMKLEALFHTGSIPPGARPFVPGSGGIREASDDLVLAFHGNNTDVQTLVLVNKDLAARRKAFFHVEDGVSLVDILTHEAYTAGNGKIELDMPAGGGRLMRIQGWTPAAT